MWLHFYTFQKLESIFRIHLQLSFYEFQYKKKYKRFHETT